MTPAGPVKLTLKTAVSPGLTSVRSFAGRKYFNQLSFLNFDSLRKKGPVSRFVSLAFQILVPVFFILISYCMFSPEWIVM